MLSDLRKWEIENIVYPLMEKLRGNRVRRETEALLAGEGLPLTELRQRQGAQLTRLLLLCGERIPAYRGLGLTRAEIEADPFAALARLPLLTKAQFQAQPEAYLDPACDKGQLIPNRTGGSTGRPLRFYLDRSNVERYEAARWQGLSWWGIGYGSRCLMVWGNPIELSRSQQRRSRWREALLKNRRILSAYDLRAESIPDYLRLLNSWQPEYLYGYATALAELARLLWPQRERLHLRRLKAAVSTAETLYPEQRALISQTFGCPVANEYGARDAGILAFECPGGHLHLSENAIIEIIDPLTHKPLPAGRSGLVVVTDLHNLVMPRLRYLLGDTATLAPADGDCGRSLPLLASLDGREDALFKLPDGTLVHGNFINQLSRNYSGIRQFQLEQTALTQARLRLVSSSPAPEEAAAFARAVAARLPGVRLTLELCPSLAASGSGKFRYALRSFPL